jgi:glycosyltransferase involved in cell wall biosynthesis
MTPLQIAYVVNVFPKLSETFIANELAELRRRGIALRVLSLRQPTDPVRHKMIAHSGLDQLTSYDSSQFISILREFQPQLIHAHFATEPAAAARDLARRLALPFTFTAHGYDIRRKPPADFADRAAAARVVVTVSEANAQHIIATFGVRREQLRVIPCGVDMNCFRPAAKPHSTDGSPLIVCVARHVKVKNLGLLLEACAELRRRGVKFRCICVGDGPCRSELEVQHAILGLGDSVEFVGAIEHEAVFAWWQRATIAALTSDNEGMPVSLMEAGACGLPAVATAVGGIPELIEHEVTGLLSPAGDALAFASALQRLLEHPGQAITMGEAARRRVETRFSLARQVDSLLALWNEVL